MEQQRSPMTDRTPKTPWLGPMGPMMLILLLVVIIVLFVDGTSKTSLPYSRFKQELREDNVKSVRLGKTDITGEFKKIVEIKELGKVQYFRVPRVGVERDDSLIELLEEKEVEYDAERDNSTAMTILAIVVVGGLLLFVYFFLIRRLGPGGQAFSFGRSRAKLYAQEDVNITFDDVAGLEEAVDELREIVDFLKTPQKYQQIGGRIPKGVLLVGPPGTGKTLLAKAVAGEADVNFFGLSGSDFVEMFVGVGAARVRDLFAQAEQCAPCIIFIDELDALGKARGAGVLGGHDEREQTLNQLLVEMDGFDSNRGVIIVAATNRPETLDTALLRPGRFDRTVVVDRPDVKGREAILRVHVRTVKVADDLDLKALAGLTPGFSGADLANLVNEAALLAARENLPFAGKKHFEEAIERGVVGLERKQRVITPDEKRRISYHECGHAIVAYLLPGGDEVHKISIIPRGVGALGYTLHRPVDDRFLMTRHELMCRIYSALGGIAAEELVFPDVSTGAQSDLQRVTQIARSMVAEFGMSEKLGRVQYRDEERSPFLGTSSGLGGQHFSEETAREIDLEVRRIVGEANQYVKEILSAHRDVLEKLAQLLLEREVLDREELKEVMDAASPRLVPGSEAVPLPEPDQLADDEDLNRASTT